MVGIARSKEWWLRRIVNEPDCPITAGAPDLADALWQIQMIAAIGIEDTDDTGPLSDLFAAIHRTAAGALSSNAPPENFAAQGPAS